MPLTYGNAIRLWVLGALQVAVGLILTAAPIMVVGFAALCLVPFISVPWLILVFKTLRRPSKGGLLLLRSANILGVLVGAGLLGLGKHMLDAAERSARAGGGLLGALGYYPIGAGLLLITLCVLSLVMLWFLTPAERAAF